MTILGREVLEPGPCNVAVHVRYTRLSAKAVGAGKHPSPDVLSLVQLGSESGIPCPSDEPISSSDFAHKVPTRRSQAGKLPGRRWVTGLVIPVMPGRRAGLEGAQPAFRRAPVLAGFRKNSAGSTSRILASFSTISRPT